MSRRQSCTEPASLAGVNCGNFLTFRPSDRLNFVLSHDSAFAQMHTETDDILPNSAFHRAEEFHGGVRRLVDVDFASSPNKDEHREEQRTLEALCLLVSPLTAVRSSSMLKNSAHSSTSIKSSLSSSTLPSKRWSRRSSPRCAFPSRTLLQRDKHACRNSSTGSQRSGDPRRLVRDRRLARSIQPLTLLSLHLGRSLNRDAGDLSVLVDRLSDQEGYGVATAPWETRYLLLLWLSVCVRLPFAFERLAPGTTGKIVDIALHGLKANGKEADAAADLLGWFYARNDVDFQPLLRLCENSLASAVDGTEVTEAPPHIPGCLLADKRSRRVSAR